jgi:hypothetical protein
VPTPAARPLLALALGVLALLLPTPGATPAQPPAPVGFDAGGGAVPIACGAALVSQGGNTVSATKLQGGAPMPVLGVQGDDRLLAAWADGGALRISRLGGAIGFDLPITIAGGASAVALAGTQLLWHAADGDHIVPVPGDGSPGAPRLLAPASLTRLDADGDATGAWALYASGGSLVVAGAAPDGTTYAPRALPRALWHGSSSQTPEGARVFADRAGGAFVVVLDHGAIRVVHLNPTGIAPVHTLAGSRVLTPAAGERIAGGTLIQTLYVVYSRRDSRRHAHAYVRRIYAGGQLGPEVEVAGGRTESDVVRDAAIGRYATLVVYTRSQRKRPTTTMMVADGVQTTLDSGAISAPRVTAAGADALVTWTKGNGRFARIVIAGVPTATLAVPPAAC